MSLNAKIIKRLAIVVYNENIFCNTGKLGFKTLNAENWRKVVASGCFTRASVV